MKKIIPLGLILILISAAASAQRVSGVNPRPQRFNSVQITRPERSQIRKDMLRLNIVQRNARRDEIITPVEKRKVQRAKCKTRRDAIRSRRNGHRRIQ